jgi:hypothetical protein
MDAGDRWIGDRVRAHVVVHPGARPAVRVHVQPAVARRRRHLRLGHPRREDPRRQVVIDWHTQQTSCYMLSLSLSLHFGDISFHLLITKPFFFKPLKCSAIGSALIVAGLYMVLWGKGKEMNGPAFDDDEEAVVGAGLDGKGSAVAASTRDAVISMPVFGTTSPKHDATRNGNN